MRYSKIFKIFLFLAFYFLAAFMFKAEVLSAKYYEYQSGDVEKKYKDTSVISFSYAYITKFEEGELDLLENLSLDEPFYSGRSIDVNIGHYNHWFPLVKDDDYVNIYKYSESKLAFATEIASFNNKEGKYLLDSEGLYKITYGMDESIEHVVYVCISKDLHEFNIVADSRYRDSSAFANFNFTLNIKDGYDLRDYNFYYAFGTSQVGLNYRKIDNLLNNTEQQINQFNDKVTVKINDADTSSSAHKKYLFVKVEYDNQERVVQTQDSYILSSKIQANVYLIDENNAVINEEVSYKKGDKIRFKIVYNAPVTYNDLKFTKDGLTFIDLEKKTDSSLMEVYVEDTVNNYDEDVEGNISFKTGNSVSPLVIYEGNNVSLEVISNASFDIDVTDPKISISDEGDLRGKKEYAVTISIEENNIKDVLYYVSSCKSAQDNICKDAFDDEKEGLISLGAAKNPTITIDDRFGKYDMVNLALFVKVFDKAGNVAEMVKYGYVMDNIIVPSGLEKDLFVDRNIEDQGETVGKTLMIEVPQEYRVNKVSYRIANNEEEVCGIEATINDKTIFKCIEVRGYDYRTNVNIKLVDELGNIEEHTSGFVYSMTRPGNIEVDGKFFDLYNDKDYEIEFKTYNYMDQQNDLVVFNGDVLARFASELNLDKVPLLSDAKKSVVYLLGEEEIVIVENVENEVSLPTISDLIEIIGIGYFNECATSKCDISLYLKYEYSIDDVPQTRLVKVNYIDGTNKFIVENLEYTNTVNVGNVFIYYEHKYATPENIVINSQNVIKRRKITFTDKNGISKVVADINASMLGTYVVSDYFEYNSIGSFPLSYTVEIVDVEAPIIRLNGKNKIYVNIGDVFVDPLAIVHDNYDQSLVIKTSSDPLLDLTKEGVYTVSYWCEDSSGNVSEVLTRTIVVRQSVDLKTYLIAGGIGLFTILVMVVTVLIEVKKERKKK